jgi:transposase
MDLRALHRHGWSISALARRFGINHRTVAREVAADGSRAYPSRAPKHSLTPAQLAHIERRLLVCPVLRATDLHRELQRDFGYRGSYPTFGRQLRQLRPPVVVEAEVRFETAAGVQTQVDWKHLGLWPLGEEMVQLHALVAVLGHSRMPAIRIASSCTRAVTFERLLRCLDDLGGVSRELLTDRDTALCTAGGSRLSPEWVDLCELLGTVPRLCRPYRAKTKGKVERVNREVQESFLAWLTGQVLSVRPTLADYDVLAKQWLAEVVMPRRHRTTKRVIAEAWHEEQRLLVAVPNHLIQRFTGDGDAQPVLQVAEVAHRQLGEHVEVRPLSAYEVAM